MSFVNIIKQADIFYDLSNTQLELVASLCNERTYGQGEMIFEENTPGTELYIIADGEVEILVNPSLVGKEGKGPFVIATLRRGQCFGEVTLVDEGLRSASARSSQPDTYLLGLPRTKLMLLCDTYPQLGYRLMRNLAADLAMKIRHTDLQVREVLTWSPRA
jgi:CRP/FNR family transcriptional regulator, cyclic AMP receptor protein